MKALTTESSMESPDMTADTTRADARAVPMSRRAALAATGAGILAVLPLPANTAPASDADTSLAALNALFDRHSAAYELDSQNWNAVGDSEEAMPKLPTSRVQIGKILTGRDDDGNDVFRPIYAYSPAEIEKHYSAYMRATLHIPMREARYAGLNSPEFRGRPRVTFPAAVRTRRVTASRS